VRRLSVVAAALAAALVAGCGDGADAPGEPPRAPATAAPGPPPPRARAVRLEATDGRAVRAAYTAAAAEPAPGVVLLHELGGSPAQWDPFVAQLHDAGYATLAYRSRPAPDEAERLPDALGALRWLRRRPEIDRDRVALVGSNVGASTALLAGAERARAAVAAIVGLSPRASAAIWSLQDSGRYRPHDVLLVHDRAEAVNLAGMLDGAVRSERLESTEPGHGLVLLDEERVRDAVLAWLDQRIG